MQGIFSEYYNLSFNELDDALWSEKTLFVFDTNVLLSAYETHPETSKTILSCIEYVSSRVWMPYQIGFEFHKNRLGIKQKNINGLDAKINEIQKSFSNIKNNLNASYFKAKHVIGSNETDITDSVTKQLADAENNVLEQLKERKQSLIGYWNEQSILAKLNSIFTDEKVGKFLGAEKIQSFREQADILWPKGIGVGSCDKGKEVISHYTNDFSIADKYGDFIYVSEIKEYLRSTNSSDRKYEYLVIVTNELKKDFWYEISGEASIPQPYLKRDLLDGTNIKDFVLLETPVFLKKIMPKLEVEQITQDAVLEEVTHNINKQQIVVNNKLIDFDVQDKYILSDLKLQKINHKNYDLDFLESEMSKDFCDKDTNELIKDSSARLQDLLIEFRCAILDKKLREFDTSREFFNYCTKREISDDNIMQLDKYLYKKYGYGVHGYFIKINDE